MALRKLQVAKKDAGARLDVFLARALPGIAPERAGQLCEEKRVRIRGKVAIAGRRLWGNEEIEVEADPPRPVVAAPDAPEIPVLYQDEALIVVDKPSGLVVEREGNGRSVVEIVGARCPGCDAEGWAAPGVAHRLDRETTGCLALPRTDAAVLALKDAFEHKQVHKRYLVLVLGAPPQEQRLEGAYGRDPKNPRCFTTRVSSARRAALSFAVRERFEGAALLEVTLETGRTHQIRVQLSEAGFPVLGDSLYGTKDAREHPAALAIGRQAVHAFQLSLPGLAPGAPQRIEVEAALPCDFARACDLIRGKSRS